jgi:hypothetical protein
MNNRRRALALAAAASLAVAGWGSTASAGDDPDRGDCVVHPAATGEEECPTTTTIAPTTTTTECTEDMPCFDCETMGNMMCDPPALIPPVDAAPAVAAAVQPTVAG